MALLAIGAALLLVSLFLDWYQPGQSAWTVFEVWDLVLAALALVALAAAAGRLGLARSRPDGWLLVPGVASFVIVVASLLNHPPAASGEGTMVGIWVALVATVLMLAGAVLSVARVSIAINITDTPGADALGADAAGVGTATSGVPTPGVTPRGADPKAPDPAARRRAGRRLRRPPAAGGVMPEDDAARSVSEVPTEHEDDAARSVSEVPTEHEDDAMRPVNEVPTEKTRVMDGDPISEPFRPAR